jgi:hypothetical protein
LVKQPRKEQLRVWIIRSEHLPGTDREFGPGLLDRVAAVGLPDQSHYFKRVAIHSAANPVPELVLLGRPHEAILASH